MTTPEPLAPQPTGEQPPLSWGRLMAAASAVLVVVGAVFTTQIALVTASSERGLDLFLSIWEGLADTVPWLPLVPLAFWFARRYPIERQRLLLSVARIAAAAFACAVFFLLAATGIDWLYFLVTEGETRPLVQLLESTAIIKARTMMLPPLTLFATAYAVEEFRRAKAREMRAVQLEAQLAHAQLENLKIQLQPHFLFNTLNTISSMVSEDPKSAERMIARLSDLLRGTLQAATTQLVPLDEELRLVDTYLEIQKERFGDRLEVSVRIEPEVRRAMVPILLLQPVVENAVSHGIVHLEDGGAITIAAWQHDSHLVVEVSNEGPELSPGDEWGTGLGPSRERLRQLYGDRGHFHLRGRPGGGARALIELPLQLREPE